MFWELSSDRNYELIGATFEVLRNGIAPSSESKPSIELISSTMQTTLNESSSSEKEVNLGYPHWETHKNYQFGDQVIYENKTYKCIQPHASLPGWTPFAIHALWQLV